MATLLGPLTALLPGDWWKALFSLLIPLAQFLWTRYGRPGSDFKKRQLRLKIGELGQQRDALKKFTDLPNSQQAVADLNAEMEACMAQLVGIGHQARTVKTGSERGVMARIFLAYTPTGLLAWVLHSAFYINALVIVFYFIGVQSPQDPRAASSTGDVLGGLAFLLIPALLIRWRARKLDHPRPRPAPQALTEPAS